MTDLAKTFNREYRIRRLAFAEAGVPCAGYQDALQNFREALADGERDAAKLWERAFTVRERPPSKTIRAPRGAVPLVVIGSKQSVEVADAIEESRARRALAAKHFRPKPLACEACGEATRIVLDHDHTTAALRGWLCDKCNWLLGHAHDNAKRLRGLAEYLEAFQRTMPDSPNDRRARTAGRTAS